ncbi:hypothetical protein Tsp_06612 [Trichinella spiralis]|uniref:hypothetical protein n=1 Tax=Trichinella spiralis TaxID=6334 RepID=UPI0001EFD0C7|nr:hypothetical protein Tsp_06612 [Trichinella spiralis]
MQTAHFRVSQIKFSCLLKSLTIRVWWIFNRILTKRTFRIVEKFALFNDLFVNRLILLLFDITMVQLPETEPGTSTCNCSGCVIVRMQHAVVVRDIPIWLPEQIVILSVMTHFRYAGKITNVRVDTHHGERMVTANGSETSSGLCRFSKFRGVPRSA